MLERKKQYLDVRNGNVTFAYLNPTVAHNWSASHTNFVGPAYGDANASTTLNLISMFHNPMCGGSLIMGRAAGKKGTLNILNNRKWEGWANSTVQVGETGVGNLNISTTGILQKSRLRADFVFVGHNLLNSSSSTGNAMVSGFNATLTANKSLIVGNGQNAIGNVTISNQGRATLGEIFAVGNASPANNVVTITGIGSELILGNVETTIGRNAGKSTLNVLGGATVTNSGSTIEIADSFGGTGPLNISGNGSQLLSAYARVMKIGNGGLGIVDVEAGGKLMVSQIDVGSLSSGSSQGSLSLGGVGSRVDLTGTQMNYIGNNTGGYRSQWQFLE